MPFVACTKQEFPIKVNGVLKATEPTPGKWYCGFTTEFDHHAGEDWDRDGEIALCEQPRDLEGDVIFVDEEGNLVDMARYDFLVEQDGGAADDDTTCRSCQGTGEGSNEHASCSACHGKGLIQPEADPEDMLDNPNWVGSRHHY